MPRSTLVKHLKIISSSDRNSGKCHGFFDHMEKLQIFSLNRKKKNDFITKHQMRDFR